MLTTNKQIQKSWGWGNEEEIDRICLYCNYAENK